ncbi:MAG: indolepyruvate ferredoxin oxidoreductase subunit alpha, partial [Selenomonadaceae bacterium]|nr:indolepyruvate ferredoxin oxidoreductase subunit alpha [Selenomonadaceae bacterium]
GNEAIAMGAIASGVNLVAGYPGTPSTEVLETVAKRAPKNVHVEWSINEKAAMEVAAGAAYSGARVLVTMKQVGLNVASDPLMSLSYIGVKGGMVALVADDPGPISSQTEQDTRTFAMYSKLPVLDPSSVKEAYEMIGEAFKFSEKYHTPVIFRPTTRIDHGYETIDVKEESEWEKHEAEGFVKDSSRWVIFPKLSFINHAKIEKRNSELSMVLSDYKGNFIEEATAKYKNAKIGIITHGISYAYLKECFAEEHPKILKVSTPFPFPEELAVKFADGLDKILAIEELDPVLERAMLMVAGRHGLNVKISGKLTGDIAPSGENTIASVNLAARKFLGEQIEEQATLPEIKLPIRPPVLCAGCPHRASFYAVKVAMKGEKTLYAGDIGCYTLGNATPLDMCDTCLCMGAGITISQGVWRAEKDRKCFAFIGDSTFFASGITGVINAYYNGADITVVILDNSTTAMTGHQPHPGTGKTARGDVAAKVSIENVLRGIGLKTVETVNPLDFKKSVETVKKVANEEGVKAIIFKSPCVAIYKSKEKSKVDSKKCVACKKCIGELGCPALIMRDGKAYIEESLCVGCALCEQICPVGAISGGRVNEA